MKAKDEVLMRRMNELIREWWPRRHEYFGVRMNIRSLIRAARRIKERAK